jgi:hypothetical protein
MAIYNPYRQYDKGMDDAYMGNEPQSRGGQYMEGYYRCEELMQEEEQQQPDSPPPFDNIKFKPHDNSK